MESLGTGARGGLGSSSFFLFPSSSFSFLPLFPFFLFFFFLSSSSFPSFSSFSLLFLFSSFLLSYFKVPICCLFDELLGIIGDDVLGAGTLDGDEALECYTALIEITELGGCL